MPTFITPEVQAKRAANLKETGKKMETLRRNEISRFLKEGIPVLCQKTRKEAISEYLITGKLPDKICIYDHDLLITSAVANNSECRKELLKELQSLEERVCSIDRIQPVGSYHRPLHCRLLLQQPGVAGNSLANMASL
jgi:hypothetical protein